MQAHGKMKVTSCINHARPPNTCAEYLDAQELRRRGGLRWAAVSRSEGEKAASGLPMLLVPRKVAPSEVAPSC